MRILPILATTTALLSCLADPSRAQVLLRDDFSGASLDTTKWSVGSWPLGRTRLGQAPKITQGLARLRFDTFDARAPGRGFLGTEIDSRQTFSLGTGVEFEVRARVNALPPGLVCSFFTYGARDQNGQKLSDEIDFEWLSSRIAAARKGAAPLQLTTYRGFNNSRPEYEDKTVMSGAEVPLQKLDLARFNTFMMRWLPDRVEWLVNGKSVRVSTAAVPSHPMSICLNFWAPQKSWIEAYSASLVPDASAAANRSWTYDVDYVEVRRIGGQNEKRKLAP